MFHVHEIRLFVRLFTIIFHHKVYSDTLTFQEWLLFPVPCAIPFSFWLKSSSFASKLWWSVHRMSSSNASPNCQCRFLICVSLSFLLLQLHHFYSPLPYRHSLFWFILIFTTFYNSSFSCSLIIPLIYKYLISCLVLNFHVI